MVSLKARTPKISWTERTLQRKWKNVGDEGAAATAGSFNIEGFTLGA